MIIFLDTSVLGLVTHPRAKGEAKKCCEWMLQGLKAGEQFVIPEIADYELRRSYVLNDLSESLARLDELKKQISYCEITTAAMILAATFWARMRKEGSPTADDLDLDADMILAAQYEVYQAHGQPKIVATTNLKHLDKLTTARTWESIT